MHLNIKNDEAHKLATELAELTGENLTSAVTLALRERLARERRRRNTDNVAARLMKIGSRYAALPHSGTKPGSNTRLVTQAKDQVHNHRRSVCSSMKVGATTATATVARLRYMVNVDTLEHAPAEALHLNEIGVCELQLDRPVVLESYADNRDLGGVILIDRLTNHTVAAGLIHTALRRADNVHPQALDVHKRVRSSQKGQRAGVVWLTGLSGAGKSTIANHAEGKLVARGRHTYLLDGDNVRRGLNRDLGFTEQDRVENIRRVAEVARLMVDAGLIVLVAFISPFRDERSTARELFEPGEFVEVYVDTPIAVAEARDPKGLYKKARRGELKNFTGIDSPYEPPEAAEIHLDTTRLTAEAAADRILAYLAGAGFFDGG